ncbi:MAG: molybdopterin molybdenumtransferase MoeA, partial [Bacteroidota bacterium]
MLNYNDALDLILNCSKLISPETEKVHILEAEGRILADDIISDIDLPPFDNSSMDGYAIEFNPEIREWDVIDEISAGNYKQ